MQSGSILIFAGNSELRKSRVEEILKSISPKLVEKHPDLLLVQTKNNKSSIGIDQIREITKFLSIKPYNLKNKAVVIFDAHKLTVQAQNALLKTLEEPPGFAVIILESKSEDALLPTVISRCRLVELRPPNRQGLVEAQISDLVELLEENNLGNRLDIAEKLAKKEREKVVSMLEDWIAFEREKMIESGKEVFAKNIVEILKIKGDLEKTNVNMRLALEVLVLRLE